MSITTEQAAAWFEDRACNTPMPGAREMFKIAADAIKKQIPAAPLPEQRYYGNGKCPRCGAVFMDKSTPYCGNCGQALDWEVQA